MQKVRDIMGHLFPQSGTISQFTFKSDPANFLNPLQLQIRDLGSFA